MKNSQISREDFVKLFGKVLIKIEKMPKIFTIVKLFEFTCWYNSDEETMYILHNKTGILITYYKLGHLGRSLACNKNLDKNTFKYLAILLENDYNDYMDYIGGGY